MDQAFWTVITGVCIYVLGQTIQNFILRSIQDFRNVLAQISHKVKFHANVISNSGLNDKLVNWASGDMRDLSCQLESKYLTIPFNSLFSKIGVLPSREDIRIASTSLVQLSNAGGKKSFEIQNADTIEKLKKHLKLTL